MPAHDALLRAAFAARNGGLAVLLDSDGRIVEANERALRILGRSRSELLGRPAPGPLGPALDGGLAKAHEHGTYECNSEVERADGTCVTLHLCVTALRDQGTLLGYGVDEAEAHPSSRSAAETTTHERLQVALTASRMGIWEWDLRSNRIEWSPECAEILGVDSFDRTLEAFEALVHPDDVAPNRVKVREAVENGRDYASEFRIRRPAGTEIWVANLARPIRDPDGRTIRLVGTVQDVTDRKRAEWSVRESEERIRIAIQAAPMSTWSLDPETETVEVFARSHSWIAGLPVTRFTLAEAHQAVHPEDRPNNEAAMRHTLATGDPFAVACRLVTQDGSTHSTISRANLVTGSDGKRRLFGVTLDVTERMLADAALANAEQRFARIFRALPVGLCIAERDGGCCVDANPALLEVLGMERSAVVGQSVLGFGAWQAPEVRAMFSPQGSARVPDVECTIRTSAGETRHVLHSLEAIDVSGRPCVLSILHDISARKRTELALLQSGKMEAVGRLAGGLAHDFNNLLSVLSATCFLLPKELELGKPIDEVVQVLQEVSERGSGLTRQLLAVSRQQVAQPATIRCEEHIARSLRLLRTLLGEDIEVRTEFAAAESAILIDPSHFEQILLNLAANARDAMPEGGRLTIRTEVVEIAAVSQVSIRVIDTGSGMSREARERAFEPFFTTKPVGRGTGLGLSVVQEIVRQAGGTISILSEEGLGTSVTVFLPRVARQVGARSAGVPRHALRGSETILVVEDDRSVRALVCTSLRSLGYSVLEAADGEEAIQRFRAAEGSVALVLTDVIMPRMSGRQLAEEVRKTKPGLGIVYMSGYPDDQLLRHGVLDGHETYLQKPFSMVEMSELVRRLLDR